MKYLILIIATAASINANAQANTKLSNLVAPTAVNQDLLPNANNTRSLGSATLNWKNFYFNGSIYKGKNRFLANLGTGNTFLGIQAGIKNTSGAYNTIIGDSALYANTTGAYNTASGTFALSSNTTGNYNTANGASALSSNSTAGYNVANGAYALYLNTIGYSNTANGAYCLYSNTTGYKNTANGNGALYYNTTGSYNTADGYEALVSNTTGPFNTANGYEALFANTTGYYNTANGAYALYSNSNGYYNTANGYEALYHNTTGVSNTAFGFGALAYNTGGSNNIAIGENSGINLNTPNLYNTISIGNEDMPNASPNQAFIGNTQMTFIGGAVTWRTYSDARIKNTIQEDVKGLDFIMRLRPVTYHISSKAITAITGGKETPDYPGKYDAEKIKRSGFIAQEVEKAAKESGYDFSGYSAPKNQWSLYSLSYEEFVVPLVKAVQELSATNNALEAKNKELEERLAKLESLVLSNTNNPVSNLSAYLKQNAPNPFTNTTIIGYYTPANAQIKVTDMKGVTLKVYSINKGEGQLTIANTRFASGTYNYTLYVGGKKVDSKQMIITR